MKRRKRNDDSIPCVFIESRRKSNYVLIMFHANAEDIGKSHKSGLKISKIL